MHVPTLNLGDLLLPLWGGTFDCAPTDDSEGWEWAVLRGPIWEAHGKAVASSRPYIPGSFDRPPRNLAEKIHSRYKAKEWQHYFFGLAPALLYGKLPDTYWQNFCKLVFAMRLVLQRSISRADVLAAQKALDEFCIEFEQLYVQDRPDRIHMVRPCLHALMHLGLQIPATGPPSLHATWTMERTIGDLGQEIRQPSNPYTNLSERALIRTQVNAIKAMKPELDDSADRTPKGSLDLGDGFMLLRAKQRYPTLCTRPESNSIRAYMNGVQSDPNDIASAPLKITRWARIRLPTGQVARSAWKENLKPSEKLRMARCIKVGHIYLYAPV
jgi:hypothetical protein